MTTNDIKIKSELRIATPKVSVIVPVYNVENYIQRCLESVINQTLKEIEVIVVNDASPDNSLIIVQNLAKKESRLSIINNEKNSGPMVARHKGCLAARGQFLTFLDGDDWLPSNALERLYNNAIQQGSDIVCGTILRIDELGKGHGRWSNSIPYGSNKIGAFKAVLNRKVTQNLCSKLFRTSLFQSHEYVVFEHNTNAEDAGILFQFIDKIHKISVINDDVYFYYMNSSSASYNLTLRSLKCICENTKLRNEVLVNYPELDDDRKKHFTNNLASFKTDKQQYSIIKEYGLGDFVSISSLLKYGSFKTLLSVFLKYLSLK